MAPTQKNIRIIFLAVLLTKLFVLIINLARKLFFTEEKNAVYRFIESFLEECDCCKKMIKTAFFIIIAADFNQVIVAGYVINYLMLEMIK